MPVRLNDVYLGLQPQFENRRAGAGERVAFDVIAVNADGRRVARARRAMAARARGLELRLVSRRRQLGAGGAPGATFPSTAPPSTSRRTSRCASPRTACARGSYRLIVRSRRRRGSFAALRRRLGRPGRRRPRRPTWSASSRRTIRCGQARARACKSVRPIAGEAQIVVATDRVIETRTVRVERRRDDRRSAGERRMGLGRLRAGDGDDAARSGEPAGAAPRRRRRLCAGRHGRAHARSGRRRRPAERASAHARRTCRCGAQRAARASACAWPSPWWTRASSTSPSTRAPNPVDYFFGRRALGVDVRDDYGRLLNPNLGAPATPRQGGDSLGGEGLTVVPTRTVALVSDIVEVRGGRAMHPARHSRLQRHAAADGGGVERECARAGRRSRSSCAIRWWPN